VTISCAVCETKFLRKCPFKEPKTAGGYRWKASVEQVCPSCQQVSWGPWWERSLKQIILTKECEKCPSYTKCLTVDIL
jgi:hypothetical protein